MNVEKISSSVIAAIICYPKTNHTGTSSTRRATARDISSIRARTGVETERAIVANDHRVERVSACCAVLGVQIAIWREHR